MGEENIFLLHAHSKLVWINIVFVNNVVYLKKKEDINVHFNFYLTLESWELVKISVVMCCDAN